VLFFPVFLDQAWLKSAVDEASNIAAIDLLLTI
jgi:hypothetical protein